MKYWVIALLLWNLLLTVYTVSQHKHIWDSLELMANHILTTHTEIYEQ